MRMAELEDALDRLSYPTTTDDVSREFGDRTIDFQDGDERVAHVLDRCGSETFTSAEEARLTVYGALSEGAIGRKGYTDRDPPGVGEVEPLSF